MDIYFDDNYGALYAVAEGGEAVVRNFECEAGCIKHQFIKRKINLPSNKPYYDIVTPYGYGGPIIVCVNEGHTREELVSVYEADFLEYAKKSDIVCEFVRFHPILKNAVDFSGMYSAECIRHTLATDLSAPDPVEDQFSRSCRKDIRRALGAGISYRVTRAPENIDAFKEIYYSTMDRNHAGAYYYFDDKYFSDCLAHYRENIIFVEVIYEGKTIAANLSFIYRDMIHIHLSGTLSEYINLSPAYILQYATVVWGKENGFSKLEGPFFYLPIDKFFFM